VAVYLLRVALSEQQRCTIRAARQHYQPLIT